MGKILLLGSQHGNELLGDQLYAYIKGYRPALLEHVEFLIANPRAHKQNIRYTESDMNRSYGGAAVTYEQKQAQKILRRIKKSGYDLVIDLHTTTCEQPACIIIAEISPKNTRFINASTIENIVVMNHPIVKESLNGACPTAVCIELNKDVTTTLLKGLCDDIERYIDNRKSGTTKHVYEVTDLLKKSEMGQADAHVLKNFAKSKFGFYPVLVGEDSYQKHTDYLGFKAYRRYKFKL